MNELWAITSFFNPAGYETKARNYRIFRDRLDIPLLTVELSYRDNFELAPGDAERLISVRGRDVMWQKERLLNLALQHLPDECVYVAWLDCDIVFGRPDWAVASMEELQRVQLCQLFHTVHHLGPGASGKDCSPESATLRHVSIGYAHSVGLVTDVGPSVLGPSNAFKRGHAWCARRGLLKRLGLYDRNVIGGGDALLAFAVTRQWDEVITLEDMSPAHAADYRQWALPFHEATQGEIGHVGGDIFHLWHGDLLRRKYRERVEILNESSYDPAADIALDTEGCWRWNSPKHEMHEKTREYFVSRSEDEV